MTSHVLYADHAHNANASVGQPAKLPFGTAPGSVVHQLMEAVQSVLSDPAVASQLNYPWLNETIRSRMSHRAHRLMRSDY